jgi:tripartite-type tricarboxylate transporter receptor subunit TctC
MLEPTSEKVKKQRRSRERMMRALFAASAIVIASAPVCSEPAETFYQGKNLNVLVGVSAGGAYDTTMRLVARHIVRFIPGNPTPVPQNMTGATGLVMANYLYQVAAKDGLFVGVIQNGLPTFQAVGMPGVQFDARKFQWIGSVAPTNDTLIAWHTTGVKSLDDARKREVVVGSIGASGITYMYPKMLNDMTGTKFRIVTGYTGGGALSLAMQRGEVDARVNSWNGIRTSNPEWLKDGQISMLVYSGRRQKDLASVPHFDDVVTDLEDRRVARIVTNGSDLGHPFAMAPGVPAERVAVLRRAFKEMLGDAQFIKDATTLKIDVDPVTHDELEQIVTDLFAAPEPLKVRARAYFERK